MDVYEALYTTRAMRRVRPDAIPQDVQARILDAAVRAAFPADDREDFERRVQAIAQVTAAR